MEAQITFRHMDHSQVIKDYAEDQLHKVYEVLSHEPDPVYIHLIFEPSKVHAHHRVELVVKSPHYDLIAHREGPEFYDLIDTVMDIMYEQLHEAKRRRVDELKTRKKQR